MSTNISHPEIVKVLNKKAVIITSVIALAGIVSLILSWFLVASTLFILAVILFLTKSKVTVFKTSGSRIKSESLYFDKEQLTILKSILEGGLDEDHLVKFDQTGSAKVDAIYSADKQFAAFQLFEFVPHKYEEYSKLITYTGDLAKKLIEYIERCKKAN
jgi:hypothetical protein